MSLMSCNLSRKMLYYPQQISENRLKYIRENFQNVFELNIKSEKNILLHGWIIKKDIKDLPTIFYFGGNAEEVSLNIEDFEKRLHANVILFNYRGYGLSSGKPSELSLKNDSEKIYTQMKEKFSLDSSKMLVMGRSLGTGIATYLSVRKGITKTILITPYESIKEVAYDYFPKLLVNFILSDTYETIKICEHLRNSVLLLVAENDEVIHPKHAEKLYGKIKCDKILIRIKNSGHNDISQKKQYWDELIKYVYKPRGET